MSLYEEAASSYAEHTAHSVWNARYERPAMLRCVGSAAGKDVLDAACASGEYIERLLEQGARVTGIDASQAMIDLARARFGDRSQLWCADLAKPLEMLADASFDVVLSSLTLHYIEDWSIPLREFFRILRPGGRLVFSTHHPAMTSSAVADYFACARITETWHIAGRDADVTFYHRPLQAIVGPVLSAGFFLRGLAEPRLDESTDDAEASRLRTSPWFLILDAQRG